MALGLTIDGRNPFNAIFLPLATRFADSLQEFGVEVYNAPLENKNNPRIIFGAHSNANFWLNQKTENDIFVNLEPIFLKTWQKANFEYLNLMKNSRVLDYSVHSKPYIKNFQLLPIPPFKRLRSTSKKSMDALFVGSVNERRRDILLGLQKSGIDIHSKFKIFGNELYENILNSKLFLDVNFHDQGSIFNMFRFCLCANSDTIYTSEQSITSDYPEVEALQGLTITQNLSVFPEMVSKLLTDENYQKCALSTQQDIARQLENKFQNFIQSFGREFI